MSEQPYGIQTKLNAGERKIGVWGTGFIGFSSMAYYANSGIKCIGYDPDAERVKRINEGDVPVHYDMESWLGFETAALANERLVEATTQYEDLLSEEIPVHFLAIPTENDGLPWGGALRKTIERLSMFTEDRPDEPILIVIESTLTPGMTEDIVFPILRDSSLNVGEDVLVGVAPRRDWFVAPNKTLDKIPRVFGGQNRRTTEYMRSVLEIICNNLISAPDHEHAELIKCIENAYRHVGIALANQLARAYPNMDMRTVLQLVGTKWNVPTYYPSVGIGGYCVPVASQYVLSGTEYKERLSLLRAAIETDKEQPYIAADALAERGVDSVAILGLAYKGDLKVDVLSPTIPIVNRLRKHDINVLVNDPYFEDDYIQRATGVDSIPFPEGLCGAEAVLLVADHRRYSYFPNNKVMDALTSCSLVVDNHRVWEDLPFEENGIEYIYTGGPGWLQPVIRDANPSMNVD